MLTLLQGVKVIELAEWAMVPSCAAVLADWGATVVKVEHPERGDPLRSLMAAGGIPNTGDFDYLVEQANHGKRSIGLNVATDEGREILLKLIADADVFVTSFLEPLRRRLRLTPDDLWAVNPRLVYARGHGQGQRGPDADEPGYDGVSYWSRSGIGYMLTPREGPFIGIRPAFGDFGTGLTMAAGVAAALYRRSVTGKGGVVDVSLLGNALWSIAADVMSSHVLQRDPREVFDMFLSVPANPLVYAYETADRWHVMLVMIQADRYWTPFCQAIGRTDLIDDAKFRTFQARSDNRHEIVEILRTRFAAETLTYWREHLTRHNCVWQVVQSPVDVLNDPQVIANSYILPHPENARGCIVSSPIQYDDQVVEVTKGAPEIGQHTEEILLEIGYTWDDIVGLKERQTII